MGMHPGKKKRVENEDPFKSAGFSQDLENKVFAYLDYTSAVNFALTAKSRSNLLPRFGASHFLNELRCRESSTEDWLAQVEKATAFVLASSLRLASAVKTSDFLDGSLHGE